MNKERAPTYSNLYDATVRTTSEYENPYDVSRRGTIAAGGQNAEQYAQAQQENLKVGSYDHQ